MKKYAVLIVAACVAGLVVPGALAKDKAERAAKKEKKAATLTSDVYLQYDVNCDKTLDDNEKSAIKKAYEADKSSTLSKYDTDSDGKLSDSEINAIPTTKSAKEPKAKKEKKEKKNK